MIFTSLLSPTPVSLASVLRGYCNDSLINDSRVKGCVIIVYQLYRKYMPAGWDIFPEVEILGCRLESARTRDSWLTRTDRRFNVQIVDDVTFSGYILFPNIIVVQLLTHVAEEIVDYAGKENTSLIIMATHGRTGIKRWALGSNADKVVRAAKCPVLLIRANIDAPHKAKLEKFIVPLDGSKQSEKVLPHVERLASRLKAEVTLLHVVMPIYQSYPAVEGIGYYGSMGMVRVPYSEEQMKPFKTSAESYLQKVNDRLMDEGVKTGYNVVVGSAGEEIIKMADEIAADMVAMSTHGESGLSRWEHGSITDKVLRAGNTPLLLVRENQT